MRQLVATEYVRTNNAAEPTPSFLRFGASRVERCDFTEEADREPERGYSCWESPVFNETEISRVSIRRRVIIAKRVHATSVSKEKQGKASSTRRCMSANWSGARSASSTIPIRANAERA